MCTFGLSGCRVKPRRLWKKRGEILGGLGEAVLGRAVLGKGGPGKGYPGGRSWGGGCGEGEGGRRGCGEVGGERRVSGHSLTLAKHRKWPKTLKH